MSDEIKFFGTSKISDDLPKFEGGIEIQPTNELCFFKSPFFYRLSTSDAKAVKPNSFPWPVQVKIAIKDEPYSPSKKIDGFKAFQKVIPYMEDLDEKKPTLLVGLPLISGTKAEATTFFYFAKDYIYAYNSNEHGVILNGDFSTIMEHAGLDLNLVYRIIYGGVKFGWIIENTFKYDDERLSEIRENSIDKIEEKESFEKFIKGYSQGFNSKTSSNKVMIPIKLRYTGDLFDFGYLIGKNVISEIRNLFRRYIREFNGMVNKTDFYYLRAISDEGVFTLAKKLVKFHNSIIKSDEKTILGLLKDFYGVDVHKYDDSSWLDISASFGAILDLFTQQLDETFEEKELLEIVEPGDEDISFSRDLKFNLAQFRICKDLGSKVQLRLQTQKFQQVLNLKIDDSSTQVANYNYPTTEDTFDLDERYLSIPFAEYKKNIENLKYEQASTAGTSAVYAPLKASEEGLISVENSCLVVPMKYLSERFGANNDLSDIVKNIKKSEKNKPDKVENLSKEDKILKKIKSKGKKKKS